MSKKLPVISGKALVALLLKQGYYVRDQAGSHVHLRHPVKPPLTVPNHRAIARGTLRAILRKIEMTPDQLRKSL